MEILLYGCDLTMDNEELDLELDKILPLLVNAEEEEDALADDELFRYLDGIELEGEAHPETEIASEPDQPEEPADETTPENTVKEKKDTPQKKENSLLLYLHDLVYFLAALLISSIFFRVVVVSGDSMYNTLVDGDYLLIISNVLYTDPQPGDVIVASKASFRGGESIVKRVIATEGQEVDIDFSTGTVYVDGQVLDEPYVYTSTTNAEGVSFPLVVEEGCLFVMGDNRAVSMDSRDPDIGLLDRREVVGKAVFLIFPGNNGGAFDRQFYRIGGIG